MPNHIAKSVVAVHQRRGLALRARRAVLLDVLGDNVHLRYLARLLFVVLHTHTHTSMTADELNTGE